MASHFCLSFRFLAQAFHGRRDRGQPEWPPSPLRVFQSLVAAAARGRGDGLTSQGRSALIWLEQQHAPILVAPPGVTASGYRLSVPNNAMDIVAKAWCRGNYSNTGDANPATHRTMKTVRPTLLLGGDAVHYLWPVAEPLADEVGSYTEALADLCRSVVALGWGIDLVLGASGILSDEQLDALPGERWLPRHDATDEGLRVPVRGSLDDLIRRHERFLVRVGPEGFIPPPPLSVYEIVEYRRATDPEIRPAAAFSLLKLDGSGFRAFDTARRAVTIVGMVRDAARLAAKQAGWPDSKIEAFILGRGESKNTAKHVAVGPRRFAYLPLPSIEGRGAGKARVVGDVRRVILSSFAEDAEAEIAWARRALSGQELIAEDEKQPTAVLSLLSSTERMVRYYTQPAASWATVTPMVLPGYDDPNHYRRRLKRGIGAEEQRKLLGHLDDRIEGLLRKAITQAGFSQVLADHAELEWRNAGFWPGTDLASRYRVPDHVARFPRLHVRLHWRDAQNTAVQVRGPVCLGGGRFYGLGLFAPLL